jgi:nucleoside-diphosphate-sugar epimerase
VNIGNPHELSVANLADLIKRLVDSKSPMEFIPLPQDDPLVRRPDVTLARSTLGWEPKVDIEEGLRRTIEWFRSRQEVFE